MIPVGLSRRNKAGALLILLLFRLGQVKVWLRVMPKVYMIYTLGWLGLPELAARLSKRELRRSERALHEHRTETRRREGKLV